MIVAKCLSALDFLPLLPFLQPNSDNALHMTLWLNRCFAKLAIKSRIFQKEKNTRKILKFFIGPFLRQISKRKKNTFQFKVLVEILPERKDFGDSDGFRYFYCYSNNCWKVLFR